jgi:hypothetical protein
MEGIMRTGRPILFSVILALSAAGAILTGPATASAATTHTHAVHTHSHLSVGLNVYYHT